MGARRPSSQGRVEVLGYRLFYKAFGEPERGTILCLHGGPGVPHDYLLSLADLAEFGYRVVFYDQLGVGKSESPKTTALFTIERAADEADGVRRALRLGKIHLLGNSYGGMLAIVYALRYAKNLRSLVIASGLASVPLTIAEMRRLIAKMPLGVRRTIARLEAQQAFDTPEYARAAMAFYRRHVCRMRTWPRELTHSLTHVSRPVNRTMWGPSEFEVTGSLRYWDVTDRLPEIRVPTLVTCGRYDEVTPRVAREIQRGIPKSKLVIFGQSSHLPMLEERERYIRIVGAFFRRHDGR